MKLEKLKAIHIHTDYKFVNNSYFFDGELFDNKTIIIQNDEPYGENFKHEPILLKNSIRDIKKAIRICKNSDLVVMYDLNAIKCRIALALPNNIKIAWRFFGYEIYGRKKELFISEKSIKYISKANSNKSNLVVHNLKKIYSYIKFSGQVGEIFKKAIKRIDYMLVLSKEEYDYLQSIWLYLPPLLQIPHRFFDDNLDLPYIKVEKEILKPKIVIGNNRSSYNNHIDIIDLIEKAPNKYNYKFTLLFNYGKNTAYAQAVKAKTANKTHFTLIEDFISPDKFDLFYQNINALVINGYREMAGANIFLAMQNGAKIYLNRKNIHLQWLLNEGFKIFTIQDFENDLNNNSITLDRELAEYNLNQLKIFSKKYTKNDFQRVLHNVLINNSI